MLEHNPQMHVLKQAINQVEVAYSMEHRNNTTHINLDIDYILSQVADKVSKLANAYREHTGASYFNSTNFADTVKEADICIHLGTHSITAERSTEVRQCVVDNWIQSKGELMGEYSSEAAFEEYCKLKDITNFKKDNTFHQNLKEFFKAKGFLSDKQIAAIANTRTYSSSPSSSHSSWMSAWYYDDNNEKRYQHNDTIVYTSTETNRERYDREAGEKALDEARKRAYFHDYDEDEY